MVSDNSSILIFREYRNYTKNDCMVARLSDFNMLEKYPVMEKREIRDFLMTENKNIFFNREEKSKVLKRFIKDFYPQYVGLNLRKDESINNDVVSNLIRYYDDLTMFGLGLDLSFIKASYTGPIQFNTSLSLNNIVLNDSVKYALMGAYATAATQRNEYYNLRYRHLKELDRSCILAPSTILANKNSVANTALYARFESNHKYFILRDIRHDFKLIPLKNPTLIESNLDYEIDVTAAIKRIKRHDKYIDSVYIYESKDLRFFIKDDNGTESERMSFSDIIREHLPELNIIEIDPDCSIFEGYYAE